MIVEHYWDPYCISKVILSSSTAERMWQFLESLEKEKSFQDPKKMGTLPCFETCLLPHGTASGLQFDWMHPEELHLTIVSLMIWKSMIRSNNSAFHDIISLKFIEILLEHYNAMMIWYSMISLLYIYTSCSIFCCRIYVMSCDLKVVFTPRPPTKCGVRWSFGGIGRNKPGEWFQWSSSQLQTWMTNT